MEKRMRLNDVSTSSDCEPRTRIWGEDQGARRSRPANACIDVHEGKAQPLQAELCHSEQSSCTLKRPQLLAAAHGRSRARDGEDIGEACGGGRDAEQDKVWGDAFGGASGDDAVVLWDIRDEDSDEETAGRIVSIRELEERARTYIENWNRELES